MWTTLLAALPTLGGFSEALTVLTQLLGLGAGAGGVWKLAPLALNFVQNKLHLQKLDIDDKHGLLAKAFVEEGVAAAKTNGLSGANAVAFAVQFLRDHKGELLDLTKADLPKLTEVIKARIGGGSDAPAATDGAKPDPLSSLKDVFESGFKKLSDDIHSLKPPSA